MAFKKIIPARMYVQVVCPGCGSVMIAHDDYIMCLTEGCDHHKVKYDLPTVTLVRRREDEVSSEKT